MADICRFVLLLAIATLLMASVPAQAQPRPLPPERSPVDPKKVDVPVSFPLGSDEDLAIEQKIQTALAKRITVDWKGVPLKDVMAQLADETDITIVLTKKIEDAGVKPDQPVTLKASKIPLRTCLRLILSDLNLTFMIKDDVIKITTVEDAQEPQNMTIRLYPVKDLLSSTKPANESTQASEFDSLIRLIQEIEPDSWQDVGGSGVVKGFENGACLFISQRDDLHETIGKLIITIRRVKTVQGLKEPANHLNNSATPMK